MTRRTGILAILVLLTCCSGCWDRVELEDIAWVHAIGFDEGPAGYLNTTFEIVIPHRLGMGAAGGGGRQGPNYLTMTIVSRSVYDSIDLAATSLGRRLSLQHTQLFLFGESLARADIRGLVSALDRFREMRRSTLIAVARGRAEDVLRVTTSPLEMSPSRFIQTVLQQQSRTGLFQGTRFASFVSALEMGSISPACPIIAVSRKLEGGGGSQDGGQPAPTPKLGERITRPEFPPGFEDPGWTATQMEAGQLPYLGGGPVAIMGTAVFSGGRMVGDLNGDETACMLMAKGDFERGGFSIADPQRPDQPEYSISVELRGRKTRIAAVRTGDSVQLDVRVSLEINYLSWRTQTDYTDPRNAHLIEQAVNAHVKKMLDRAIARTQKMNADVFGFGDKVRHTFLTWPEFDRFAWISKYPQAIIRTTVNSRMTRYGLDFAPPRVPPGESIVKQREGTDSTTGE
ncbi:MAG: Ger(x)C family spore germination protein [Bacillota bacterium]